MRMTRWAGITLVLFIITLGGCAEWALERAVPVNTQKAAKEYIDLLRSGRIQELEKFLDPGIRSEGMTAALTAMAAQMSPNAPSSVELVGASLVPLGGLNAQADTGYSYLWYQYGFGEKWVLVHIAIHTQGDETTVVALSVKPIQESLEDQNSLLKLSGKSLLQYLTLAAVILLPIFTLYVMAQCAQLRMGPVVKIVWLLFILYGFGHFGVNWTTGDINMDLFALQALNASADHAAFSPWMISVSFPLGAIVFLIMRKTYQEPPQNDTNQD